MCDAALDRDMYDHSTDSGNFVTPEGVVDPIRSDPRWPIVLRRCRGNENKAARILTRNDSGEVRTAALLKFWKWQGRRSRR